MHALESCICCSLFVSKMHATFAWYDFVNSSLAADICFFFFVAVAFASVDWHDFVVVETVDFKDSETGKIIINHDIPCDMRNGECHIRST